MSLLLFLFLVSPQSPFRQILPKCKLAKDLKEAYDRFVCRHGIIYCFPDFFSNRVLLQSVHDGRGAAAHKQLAGGELLPPAQDSPHWRQLYPPRGLGTQPESHQVRPIFIVHHSVLPCHAVWRVETLQVTLVESNVIIVTSQIVMILFNRRKGQ